MPPSRWPHWHGPYHWFVVRLSQLTELLAASRALTLTKTIED